MASNLIDISIPQYLVPFLSNIKDGNTIDDKAIISIVISLFISKNITLEKAAELSNKNIWEFIDLLKTQNIPWGEYTEESIEMDDLALNKLSGGFYE